MKRTILFLLTLCTTIFLCAGCEKSTPKEADLSQIMEMVKQEMTNTQMMELSAEDLMPNYGIETKDVKQFAAYIDSTGTKGDEILLFEGIDDSAANRIEEKLNNRYHQKEIEMKDYLPEEYAILQKCKVEREGNFVALIVSPQYKDFEEMYHNALE